MPQKCLIDVILPEREVSLIGGPSGSGKTTWALQTLVEDWQHGKDVLGFKSHPVPWIYVSSDRSLDSVSATMERLKIPPKEIRVISCVDEELDTMDALMKRANQESPRPQFFFIDGFLNFLPDKVSMNDNQGVAKWLKLMARNCKKSGITILGCLHSPKMKKDDYYTNPRQRISGGASWGGFSESVFLVEPISPDDVSQADQRRLLIIPRQGKMIEKHLSFNSEGRLVESEEALTDDLFYAFLLGIKPGSTFNIERLLTVFQGTISHAAAYRLLDKYLQLGAIEQVSKGIYRKISQGGMYGEPS